MSRDKGERRKLAEANVLTKPVYQFFKYFLRIIHGQAHQHKATSNHTGQA